MKGSDDQSVKTGIMTGDHAPGFGFGFLSFFLFLTFFCSPILILTAFALPFLSFPFQISRFSFPSSTTRRTLPLQQTGARVVGLAGAVVLCSVARQHMSCIYFSFPKRGKGRGSRPDKICQIGSWFQDIFIMYISPYRMYVCIIHDYGTVVARDWPSWYCPVSPDTYPSPDPSLPVLAISGLA